MGVLAGSIELDEIDTEPFQLLTMQSAKWKDATPEERAAATAAASGGE